MNTCIKSVMFQKYTDQQFSGGEGHNLYYCYIIIYAEVISAYVQSLLFHSIKFFTIIKIMVLKQT